MLQNPKHEIFAQSMAKGLDADESYIAAGYSAHRGNAHRMSTNENVRARIDEILGAAAERVEITIYSLAHELDQAKRLALKNGQAAAAVSAVMGKAKLFGFGNETKVNLTGRLTLEQLVMQSIEPVKKDEKPE